MRKCVRSVTAIVISLSLFVIAFDQVTKRVVQTKMHMFDSVPVINNVLHFTYIVNTGAAFGILKGKQGFFLFTTILALLLIFSFIRELKDDNILGAVSLGFILGGAIGNFLDRIIYGFVVDFIEVKINFPIFNIADSAIFIGIVLMFLDSLISKKEQNKAATSADGEAL